MITITYGAMSWGCGCSLWYEAVDGKWVRREYRCSRGYYCQFGLQS